jgi:acid phosphatase type 7
MLLKRLGYLAALMLLVVALVPLCLQPAYAEQTLQAAPVDLTCSATTPFRFVAYGDTRFTDPSNTKAANPEVRRDLIAAIASAKPAFISIGGDIAYNGYSADDWKVYDQETEVWRQGKIAVYPALGNHDLHGDQNVAQANYFERFPELKGSVYYSVHCANVLMLVLDSAQDEVSGPQGDWLKDKLDHITSGTDFVIIVLHHPPYTSSSDHNPGGGHSARPREQALAAILEQRQQTTRARFVVFAGHVHNYEHFERDGVHYFVTGGGAAHSVPIKRTANDLFQDKDGPVNYHYLLVAVKKGAMTVTMNRLAIDGGKANWTEADIVHIAVPTAKATRASAAK